MMHKIFVILILSLSSWLHAESLIVRPSSRLSRQELEDMFRRMSGPEYLWKDIEWGAPSAKHISNSDDWCVTDAAGRIVVSGSKFNNWLSLLSAIRDRTAKNQIEHLADFLKSNPNRIDVNRRFVGEASVIIGRRLRSLSEIGVWSDKIDELLWAEIVKSLDRCINEGVFEVFDQDVLDLLKSQTLKKRGGIVSSLFERKRLDLLAYVSASPLTIQSRHIVDILNAGNVVKSETKTEWGFHHPLASFPDAYSEDTVNELVARARKSGQWGDVVDNLESILDAELMSFAPSPDVSHESDQDQAFRNMRLHRASENILMPILEGLLRQHQDARATSIIARIDGRWNGYPVSRRAALLAQRLGRPDLAKSWGMNIDLVEAGGKAVLPQQLRPLAFRLLLVEQTLPAYWQERVMGEFGYRVRFLRNSQGLLKLAKLNDKSVGWALLSPAGHVVISGSTLPDPEAFSNRLRENGIIPLCEAAKVYLHSGRRSFSAMSSLIRDTHARIASLEFMRDRSDSIKTVASSLVTDLVYAWKIVQSDICYRKTLCDAWEGGASSDFMKWIDAAGVYIRLKSEINVFAERWLLQDPNHPGCWKIWLATSLDGGMDKIVCQIVAAPWFPYTTISPYTLWSNVTFLNPTDRNVDLARMLDMVHLDRLDKDWVTEWGEPIKLQNKREWLRAVIGARLRARRIGDASKVVPYTTLNERSAWTEIPRIAKIYGGDDFLLIWGQTQKTN